MGLMGATIYDRIMIESVRMQVTLEIQCAFGASGNPSPDK
jgi:hypothetical protein